MAILQVNNISKSFGNLTAVDKVSFSVDRGHVYGLLGPNGAGKTTTIRMIMNIIIPDSGSILLFDRKMTDELKYKIGYLPEERGVYPKMKVINLLAFMGELHGLSHKEALHNAAYWLERFELNDRAQSKVEELSKGNQQKLQFINTIIHDPQFIILDEPFSGLDPVNVNLLKEIILEFKSKDKAVIFSTHQMETAEKLCDEILMIDKGRKVLDGDLLSIQNRHGKNSFHIEYDGDAAFIKDLDSVRIFDDFGNYAEIQLKENVTPNDFLKQIVDKIQIISLQSRKSSLNEIFLQFATGGNEDEKNSDLN